MEPKAKYPTFRESGGHFSATKSEQQRTSITVLTELCLLLLVGDRTACCVLLCVESPTGKDAALPGVGLPCRPTIVGALIGWESGMTAFLCECSSLCSQALGESKASMPWC